MEKTEGEILKEKLFNDKKVGWETTTEEEKEKIFKFADEYMYFMNHSKTEREVITSVIDILEKNNFKRISEKSNLNPGDKVYYVNRDKSLYAAVIGEEKLENGLNRIKKYQWTTIPLSMHGVIVKTNGEKINISIGESEEDPIFTITDLLPHLAQAQMEKKLREGVSGEDLNLLIGSIPFNDKKVSEKIKLNILNILNEKYGITELDLMSSEIELVPAFKARSLGFDRSMVAAYGQDDKICVYTSLRAIINVENPKKTAVCIFSDKEEIGSMGNTGMESHVFDTFIAELLDKTGENRPNLLEKVFCNSKMLSADVDAGYDPIYANVSEKNNSAYLGRGVGVNKYTGSRGKSGASDANAEFVAYVRNIFESNNIKYQVSELGKVDVGGGGTIAYILANKGIDVIDCGVPVLSMHAPYEVTSKYDVYTAYLAYTAFFQKSV